MDLLLYAIGLCVFIPLWVFIVLGFQFLWGSGVMSVGDEHNALELSWTFLPTAVVAYFCWLNLGSSMLTPLGNEFKSVLILGNQWYWSYGLEKGEDLYDSVMLDFIDSVDKPLRLSYLKFYYLLVTSADVIHSFSVPPLDLKVDGIPGRVNELVLCSNRIGTFVGYCSELCGAGHAYMPIVIEVVPDQL